jgi:DNA-binding response OmpR family regulator
MLPAKSPPLPVVPGVLLVEDNQAYRELLTEVLTLEGFAVTAVPDGRRVPEIIRTHAIDLVITDLSMPERDGIETMTELHYSHPRLPVIAISGDVPLNTHLYLTIAAKLGASRVLAKPFKMDELVSAARAAIAGSSLPGSSEPRASGEGYPDITRTA